MSRGADGAQRPGSPCHGADDAETLSVLYGHKYGRFDDTARSKLASLSGKERAQDRMSRPYTTSRDTDNCPGLSSELFLVLEKASASQCHFDGWQAAYFEGVFMDGGGEVTVP